MRFCRAITIDTRGYRSGTLALRDSPRQVSDVSLLWIVLEPVGSWFHDKIHPFVYNFSVLWCGCRRMICCTFMRIAGINQRLRNISLRAKVSSVVFLPLARFSGGFGRKCWSCSCSDVPIDAVVALFAGSFREEGASAVMVILAGIALVTFPFQEISA